MAEPIPDRAPIYERMTVIGCGLIGSSVLRAARVHGVARTIVACDASAAVLERVKALGIADEIFADPVEAVRGSDLVVIRS